MKYLRDKNGNTPLLYAIKRRSFEMVKTLLDFLGKNPDYINKMNFKEIRDILILGPLNLTSFLE